jgi:hypothetical protein
MTRHKRPNRCPYCNAATFRVEIGFTKPQFACDNGCSGWSSGLKGEPYLEHARNYSGGGPERWVEYIWRNGGLHSTGQNQEQSVEP